MKNISDGKYTGFRYPTSGEMNQISQWFEVYYNALIKLAKTLRRIFCVVGLFFCGSLGFNSEVSITSIVVAIVCFVIVLYCIKAKNNYTNIISEFKSGRFVVMEGIISKMETNPEYMNCVNVRITSVNSSCSEEWYRVRKEFVSIGSSIILVCSNSNNIKKTIKMAFTPFMLTDEGIKLQK